MISTSLCSGNSGLVRAKPDSVLKDGKPGKVIWLRLSQRKELQSSTGIEHRAGGAELAWWQNLPEMVPAGKREQRRD